MKRSLAILAGLSVLVAACAPSGPPRTPRAVIERALAGAPGAAQPSTIVATELAFARMAREEGQWTAFREYAAEGAQIHGRNGPVPAEAVYGGKRNPDKAVQWAPRAVWMSCGGDIAVSTGRFRQPDGLVGTFVTVWQRQNDNTYRYTFDVGAPDNPQPPPAAPEAPPEDDEIVVSAINAIEGNVADCPRRGETVPPLPLELLQVGARSESQISADGTLRWRWIHTVDGMRGILVEILQDGEWKLGLSQTWTSGAGDQASSTPVNHFERAAEVSDTDRAMALLGKTNGPLAALAAQSAPRAVVLVDKPLNAREWLEATPEFSVPVDWEPHRILISCDGEMAVTTGPISWGDVPGYYTTLWSRFETSWGEPIWRWVASHGDGLPEPLGEPASPRIEAASCAGTPGVPISAAAEGVIQESRVAPDQSLIFGWRVMPDGSRTVTARLWDGERHRVALTDRVQAR